MIDQQSQNALNTTQNDIDWNLLLQKEVLGQRSRPENNYLTIDRLNIIKLMNS